MKKVLLLVCFPFIFCSAFSQSTFDKSLNEVSADIAGKLSQKNKKKIVVLYVTDINKALTVAGKYMADVISVNIVNDQGNFEIFDRENLSGIVEAKKMMAEGYIDANKAKELGRILAVDAIVIGNYTVLTTTLKLTLKALDVNSGFVIAATMKDLPLNNDAGSLLGINVSTGGETNSNRGFNNTPLKSNENYNNPERVNKECETNNTGDYCITNQKNFLVTLSYSRSAGSSMIYYNSKKLTIEPNQTNCLYELESGVWDYTYSDQTKLVHTGYRVSGGDDLAPLLVKSQFKIEKCTSKTLIIK